MNLLDKIVGVIVRPKETMQEISDKPYIEEAVLIIGLTAIISGISAYLMNSRIIYDYGDMDPKALEFINTFMPIITIISALFSVIIIWIIAAGIVHLISMMLGGEGTFTQMLVVYGFAYIPVLFSVIIGMVLMTTIEPVTISVSTGGSSNVMSGLMSNPYFQASVIIGYIMKLWTIGLVFLGVKSVHGLNTNRALIAISIPLLFMILGMLTTLFSDQLAGLFT